MEWPKGITIVIISLLISNSSCTAVNSSAPQCTLIYESLSDEALREVITVRGLRIGFAQHEENETFREISLAEGLSIQSAFRELKLWAHNTSQNNRGETGNGEFIICRCDKWNTQRTSLALASQDVWDALAALDQVFSAHFPDYTPIAKNAQTMLGCSTRSASDAIE